ncbi:MAG: cytochrome P450 [Oleispira sp.]|nr:cytochrome P450 [Oleispira sp.]
MSTDSPTAPSKSLSKSTFKQIPGPKGGFLLGNLSDFKIENIHHFLQQTAQTYGSLSRIRLANQHAIILANPETVQQCLKRRPDAFKRYSAIETIFAEMGIEGVFSAEGDRWKRHRELIMPAFKPAQIKAFYPILDKFSKGINIALAENISSTDNQQAVDIQAIFKNYTTDITTKLAFGVDTDCLGNQGSELRDSLNKVFPITNQRLKSPFPYWRFIKLRQDREFERAIKTVKSHLSTYITNAQIKLAEDPEPSNILESMIIATNDAGDQFTETELLGNAITILLAGEDTTANTLAWTIHYLACNPEIQTAIQQEIDSKLNTETPSFDQLDDFPLTFAAAQEAIRLKPVAPFMYMENINDEVIEGHHIPAGTLIFTLLNHESTNPELFENPEQFNPQRWLALSTDQKRTYSKVLMPFGAGARLCPDRLLSFIEMKSALITILKKYSFSHHNGKNTTEDSFEFTLVPKGLRVNIQRR